MSDKADRLYELLPVIYRQRDAEQGYPLRALLRVIAEQVNVVDDDIAQLYENWFIETCEDWVVPYIGELVGYRIVHEAGEPGDVTTEQGRLRNRILIPRREVANTIRYRRRKGTLALLELLANDAAGWPARAVEFYRLLGWTQAVNHRRLLRGRTTDLRLGDALERLDGPFDELAHTVEVRRVNSPRSQGRYNIPSVGVFVWRLRSYSVTQTPAYCVEAVGPQCYTFSALGGDTPLYTRPEREEDPTDIAGELNLPVPIRRRPLERRLADYYAPHKSLQVWRGHPRDGSRQPLPPEEIIVADLSDWQYKPLRGTVAVDPQLGRLAFPPRELPKKGVWVSYHYGFSADIGGGEYERVISQPIGAKTYTVGERGQYARIRDALKQWYEDRPPAAVIEITDSGAYVEQINIELEEHQRLQLRAANRTRPIIRLLDWQTDLPDNLTVTGERGSRFTLDGILVTGRGVQVEGQLAKVEIRHSTLVPGWILDLDCEPRRPAEPSLELIDTQARVSISDSIVGSIQVIQDEVEAEPTPIEITDSILDATAVEREAVGAPTWPMAHAVLTIRRCTVFGEIQTHAIDLAENSLFIGLVKVVRSQRGCMRFCYVTPGSRTPRRYNCQPDLVERAVTAQYAPGPKRELALERELLRVRPQFNSTRYGTPTYCQLTDTCAAEITRGADDESEMGAFHDLFQPQREANLRTRLDEYTPAGMEAGIIYAS
ncbi:MAG: hypothetical protein PVI07_01290 [Anaerolineae bacterium]|jgi:hypothetical protein